MFGRLGSSCIVGLVILICLGCAKPNYADSSKEQTTAGLGENEKLTDCELRFQTEALCLNLTWSVKPTETEKGSFLLTLSSPTASGELVLRDPKRVLKVLLWMPSMGHGSLPVHMHRLSKGVYEFTNVFFIMPGDWEIRFQLTGEGQSDETVAMPLTI